MSNNAYIFLDEGGNFDFSATGTRYFTLTCITKRRPFRVAPMLDDLKYALIDAGQDVEHFHATEDKQAVRDKVFGALREHGNFTIDALIVEKPKTGPALWPEAQFYPRMLGYLLRYVLERTELDSSGEVVIITDNIPLQRKRRAVEKAIKLTLAEMLSAGRPFRVLHHASKSSFNLQIADYCNWALFRKWERGDLRSYDIIKPFIRSEFEIFRNGQTYYYDCPKK